MFQAKTSHSHLQQGRPHTEPPFSWGDFIQSTFKVSKFPLFPMTWLENFMGQKRMNEFIRKDEAKTLPVGRSEKSCWTVCWPSWNLNYEARQRRFMQFSELTHSQCFSIPITLLYACLPEHSTLFGASYMLQSCVALTAEMRLWDSFLWRHKGGSGVSSANWDKKWGIRPFRRGSWTCRVTAMSTFLPEIRSFRSFLNREGGLKEKDNQF